MLADRSAAVPPDDIAARLSLMHASKDAGVENFPVASRLLPAATRGAVLAFYRFARATDDVADSDALTPDEKLAVLDAADRALCGKPVAPSLGSTQATLAAHALRGLLAEAGVTVDHARHLLQAFRKDAAGAPYRDWSDLLLYCNFSAAPVGRFLLDLHGQDRAAWAHSDPLCNAHQILNHVQDCRADYVRLQRVYLPQRWLHEAGATEGMLEGPASPPQLRRVLDRVLDGAERLLAMANPLPGNLRARGLRIQAAATLRMGWLLLGRLRKGDPVAGRIALGAAAKAGCAAAAAIGNWRAPAVR